MADRKSNSDEQQVVGQTRVIGRYLLFIAGVTIAVGLAFGIFMYLMSSLMGAGAGPSDPAEIPRFVENSFLVSGVIIGLGILVGVFGLYRTYKPLKIKSQ